MKVSKIPGLGRFGIYIDDVDFNTISNEEWMEIGQLHLQNLVTIIRNTNLTNDQQIDFTHRFGHSRFGTKNYFVNKYNLPWDYIITLTLLDSTDISLEDRKIVKGLMSTLEKSKGGNVVRVSGGYDAEGNPRGCFAEGALDWHSNESGTLTFSPGVALLAVKNVVGSATSFLTTADYYENINDSFRRELDEMILIHNFTPGKINPGLNAEQDRLMQYNMCPVDGKEIPMVITSPGGIKGLHYSVNTAWGIKGLSKAESDKVFARINKELFVDKYIYDHWYQNTGDFLLFDNSITLHRRLGNIKDRLCYRIQHDYTNLQVGPWLPYSQPEVARQYRREIRNFVKATEIKDFKLPPRHLSDFIPFLK